MKSFYHYFSGEEKEVGIDLAVIAHKDTKKKERMMVLSLLNGF